MSQAQESPGGRDLQQTYYTDARASQVDPRYLTSNTVTKPNNFSPIALNIRATPTQTVNANVRAEIDSRYHQLRTISANGTLNWRQQVQTSLGWTKNFFIAELDGYNDPTYLDQLPEHLDQRADARSTLRVDVLDELRRPAQHDAAAEDVRVLQRAVLRDRVRVPALQLLAGLPSSSSPPTTDSSCRSRWPAWATSRPSTAR